MEWPFEEGGRTERAHAARGVHVCGQKVRLLICGLERDEAGGEVVEGPQPLRRCLFGGETLQL